MNPILMKAIIDLAAFLELSDDDTVDPDAAVQQLEELVAALSQLTIPEREELVAYVDELIQDQQEQAGSKEYIDFLLSFPESFGLRD